MQGSRSIPCTEKRNRRAGSEIANEQNKAGKEKPPSDFRATFLDPLSLSNVIDFIDFYRRLLQNHLVAVLLIELSFQVKYSKRWVSRLANYRFNFSCFQVVEQNNRSLK